MLLCAALLHVVGVGGLELSELLVDVLHAREDEPRLVDRAGHGAEAGQQTTDNKPPSSLTHHHTDLHHRTTTSTYAMHGASPHQPRS